MTDPRWRRLLVALCLAMAALPAGAGRAAAPDEPFYSRKRVFLIPYQTEGGDRPVQKVILHVSENRGKNYFQSGVAAQTSGQFKFTTDHDGEYWFAVQTQDTRGELHPPVVDRTVQPLLKVVVDSKPPTVVLDLSPTNEGVLAEWQLSDETPGSGVDEKSLQLTYLPPGGREYVPLYDVRQTSLGSHRWTPPASGRLRVRLQVKDRAGNTAVEEKELVYSSGAAPSGPSNGSGFNSPPAEPRGDLVMVKSRTFNLNYEVDSEGPSGVQGVDVFYLPVSPDGKEAEWVQFNKTGLAKAKGPLLVEVPAEGRYGFAVVPKNGSGLSDPPPKSRDRVQLWVEVDETPPVVKLTALEMGKGLSHGRLTIRWEATDRHLTARPIRVAYSDSANPSNPTDWKTIAENLANADRNAGSYVWDIQAVKDKLPDKVYIRVEAVDQAGNLGSAVSQEPVPTDLTIPRVRRLNVDSSAGSPGPASGSLSVSPAVPAR
jgi:hypothetical protein